MSTVNRYAEKILRVNLSDKKISVKKVPFEVLRKFVGGAGVAVKILYEELPMGTDPLSPENKLVFGTGPLTGTFAPGSGFATLCFKSPLTGVWTDSRAGGEWGGALRKAGYDFLIIEGKAEKPSYIVINDDEVEIRSAEKLREKTISEKTKLIKEELNDDKFIVAAIGPAGENLVRFANVMVEGSRAFGRCGGGAVMGSKNLLAVVVKGTGQISIAKPEEFRKLCKELNQKVLSVTGSGGMSEHGTTGDIASNDELGDIPTKNWRSNSWGKGKALYDHFYNKNFVRAKPCYPGCVLRCGRLAKVDSGKWKTPVHEGNEYESLSAFTFFVLNEDMDAAVHADHLCNEYGLDTISTGAVIAFAMECYEAGILGKEDADGLDLRWGNADTMIELIKKITYRDGIGNILAEGVRCASQIIGKGSEKFAIHVKGLEGPAHDPRSGKALAVNYGVANRGMCHIHPLEGMAYDSLKNDFGLIPYGLPDPNTVDRWAEEGKGKAAKLLQDWGTVPDVAGFCKFFIYNGITPDDVANLLSALTGWEITGEEILKIGERVFTLQRMFNVREGIRKKDDMVPERVLKIPEFGKYSSVKECEVKNYDGMLKECYEARGWDENGVPKPEKLKELELG